MLTFVLFLSLPPATGTAAMKLAAVRLVRAAIKMFHPLTAYTGGQIRPPVFYYACDKDLCLSYRGIISIAYLII